MIRIRTDRQQKEAALLAVKKLQACRSARAEIRRQLAQGVTLLDYLKDLRQQYVEGIAPGAYRFDWLVSRLFPWVMCANVSDALHFAFPDATIESRAHRAVRSRLVSIEAIYQELLARGKRILAAKVGARTRKLRRAV